MGRLAGAVVIAAAATLGLGGAALGGASERSSLQAAEQQNLDLIHAQAATQAGGNCAGATIAVIDSGLAPGSLRGAQVLLGWNELTHTANTTDLEGHGTKVAGVIAGSDGICAKSQILPVVVWSKTIDPAPAAIAAGIDWAVAHGAGVVNISIAGGIPSALIRHAIDRAIDRNVVVVAAAGNTGADLPQYPAAYPGVLAVSGTDSSGALTAFSTFGSWIGIAAPSTRVLTTTPSGAIVACDGTSFAAPAVAAAAALLRTKHPDWKASEVVQRLEQTADDAGPPGVDPAFGHGILDLAAALGLGSSMRAPVAPGDSFEPNNVPAQATPVSFGTTLDTTFAPEGDVDWYAIDVMRATGVSLVATAPLADLYRSSSPVIDVYDQNLRLLAHRDARYDGAPGRLELTFPAQTRGRYYVRVTNAYGSRGSYGFAISRAPLSHWAAWQDLATGVEGSAVAVGDVTGDGRADVLMTTTAFSVSPYAGRLLLFVQRPDGTLAPPVILPQAGPYCCGDVTVGDLNGDGKLDVAATLGPSGVEVFHQHDGRLGKPMLIHTASSATAVRIRNGKLLVALADGTNASLTHEPTPPRPDGCEHAIGVDATATGDVNGDGLPDIVCPGPYGLIVVRARSSWTAPGTWIDDVQGEQVHFALPISESSLSSRTVSAFDAHGNRIHTKLTFSAATNTLTLHARGAAQIRIVDVRARDGDVMPSPFTSAV